MSNLYTMFKTEEKHETQGVWLEYGRTDPTPEHPEGEPIRIKIARAGGKNMSFNKALEKATRPYRKAIQTGTIALDTIENLYREVFVDHVVLDWTNVSAPIKDASGAVTGFELLPYKRDNVLRVLIDLPDLYNDLKEQANSLSLFREDEREADLGNSGQS